jgi:hypothetical protein
MADLQEALLDQPVGGVRPRGKYGPAESAKRPPAPSDCAHRPPRSAVPSLRHASSRISSKYRAGAVVAPVTALGTSCERPTPKQCVISLFRGARSWNSFRANMVELDGN